MTEIIDVSDLRQWGLLKQLYENPTIKFGNFLKNNSYPHQAGKHYTQIRNKNVLILSFPTDKRLMFIDATLLALKQEQVLQSQEQVLREDKSSSQEQVLQEEKSNSQKEPVLNKEFQMDEKQTKSSKQKQAKDTVLVDVRQLPSVNRIKLLDILAGLPVEEKLKMISILKDLPLEEKCSLINLLSEI